MFESRVVRLRTGKMALNTFKNIHLQSNTSESSEEGTGRRRAPAMCATASGVAGGLGPGVACARGKLLTADSLPGHSAFDRLLTKGEEGWFYLQSRAISVEHTGKLARQAEQKDQAHSLRKGLLFGPPRGSPFPSSVSVFGFLQEKILAASLTKIPISFYKRTLNSSVAKRRTAFHAIPLFASSRSWV